MSGLDFFFSPSATTVDASIGNNGEDDDWGDFVDSSPNPIATFPDLNGTDSTPNRIDFDMKDQAQWVTSRGPLPLSLFGDEENDESGASGSSFKFSSDSFSSKHNDGTASVNRLLNANPAVGISGLITNLYRENGQSELTNALNLPGVSSENLNWNPLNLDTESSERTRNVVNSSTTTDPTYSDLSFADKNDDDDGWEFKTAESMFTSADGGSNDTTNLSSSVWISTTDGTGPNFDTGKVDASNLVFDRETGDDDPWGNGGWEFKVAEAKELVNDLSNKEANGWGFGLGSEPVSKIETTTSFPSNFEKEMQKRENGVISFPNNTDANTGGTSWAFNQPSLETGNKKEEKEVQTDKRNGLLPLSFFEDEKSETSDTLVDKDNLGSVCDFSVRMKTKAPSPNVSINDLISSLYSQVEEKNDVNLSEKPYGHGFVSEKAATDSKLVNGEDDSWEFQGPTTTITDWSTAEGADDFDSTWEFQGPSLALENSDVTKGVTEFDDDSWDFQGPAQPVRDSTSRKGDNGRPWESIHSSVANEVGNRFSISNGFEELHEKPVISIKTNDYQDVFHKLKTELYYIALHHLETLKEARDLAADSGEVAEVQKCDGEIQDLQKSLNNDVLIGEVNVESLQPRPSGIAELYKALQEPMFRALDSEDLLSEKLLLAVKDWKSTIELLKYTTSTLKILISGTPEQQSKYISTWFVIASACAEELRHAASIWKRVIENEVQEEIISKSQGKRYALSVGEIYRVVKILRASTRLYKAWILVGPTSTNVLGVLDECVKLWESCGLEEALMNSFNGEGVEPDLSGDQLVESIKYIDKVDGFKLHRCINRSDTTGSGRCYISGLNTLIVPGMKMVEWKGEQYLVALANLWSNLISRDPPQLPAAHCFATVS